MAGHSPGGPAPTLAYVGERHSIDNGSSGMAFGLDPGESQKGAKHQPPDSVPEEQNIFGFSISYVAFRVMKISSNL